MTEGFLPAIEIETHERPEASVIWLHGLGADGNDFVPVVEELGLPEGVGVRFIFPHAPVRAVTVNGGFRMRAWYDVLEPAIDSEVDQEGVRDSMRRIADLLRREEDRGISSRSIILAGFSQGGAVALETGLRHSTRLAGILALSTYLPLGDALARELSPQGRDVPILMMHGTEDPIVPHALGERTRRTLEGLGYAVEWRSYPMEHSVCLEQIVAIGAWLRLVLGLR